MRITLLILQPIPTAQPQLAPFPNIYKVEIDYERETTRPPPHKLMHLNTWSQLMALLRKCQLRWVEPHERKWVTMGEALPPNLTSGLLSAS